MTKILLQAPFLRLLLSFIAGIITQYHNEYNQIYLVISALSIILLLLSFIPIIKAKYYNRWIFGAGIISLSFSTACLLTKISLTNSEWDLPIGLHTYYVNLEEDTVIKSKSVMCKVKFTGIFSENQWQKIDKKGILYLSLDSLSIKLKAGDFLLLKTTLEKPKKSVKKMTFDYALYLKQQGYTAIGYVSKESWEQINSSSTIPDLKTKALALRKYLLTHLKKIFPDKEKYGIAAALVFGYSNALENETKTIFAATGISHVLAVSGLHTSIIYGTLYFLFSFLGQNYKMKLIRQLIILLLMWVFAFVTGLSASVVRATIMISFVGIGNLIERKSLIINTISASAFIMLLYNPLYLFNVSFQLSYSAVISIILIYPYFESFYTSKNPIIKYVWSLTCVTFAAQFGTTPLSIYYFHQFPTIFPLTNLFAIPITSVLLILIPLCLILIKISFYFQFLVQVTNLIMDFFILGTKYFENTRYGIITNISIDIFQTLLLYTMFSFTALAVIRKKFVYVCLLTILAVFQVIYYL